MQKIKYIFIITLLIVPLLLFLALRNKPDTQLVTPETSVSNSSMLQRTVKQEVTITPITNSLQIFEPKKNKVDISNDMVTTIIAAGDIIPARSVNFKTIQYGDWKWAFTKTAEYLRSGDITYANLEAPLLKNCPVTNEGMVFCGDARHIEGLLFSGIDIVSTANNHYGNHGIEGINESNVLLQTNRIHAIQNSNTKPIIHNGTSFLFLNYNEIGYKQDGLDWAENEKIRNEMQAAGKQADVVIVAFHWGTEYTTEITDRQRELAHLAIDNGADLVLGNHPHWIQPLEMYNGKLIMYAHGNFVFDQMWSQETREGVVGRYVFYGKDLIEVEYRPVQIDDYGQPHFVEGEQKERILSNLKRISEDFN